MNHSTNRASKTRTAPQRRPILVWDGDCSFCKRSKEWLQRRTGGAVEYRPYQEVEDRFPDLASRFPDTVHLIDETGRVSTGAEAIVRALALGGHTSAETLYDLPGVAGLGERVYRWVAEHRPLLSKLTKRS